MKKTLITPNKRSKITDKENKTISKQSSSTQKLTPRAALVDKLKSSLNINNTVDLDAEVNSKARDIENKNQNKYVLVKWVNENTYNVLHCSNVKREPHEAIKLDQKK